MKYMLCVTGLNKKLSTLKDRNNLKFYLCRKKKSIVTDNFYKPIYERTESIVHNT